jgi:hypothetical protein
LWLLTKRSEENGRRRNEKKKEEEEAKEKALALWRQRLLLYAHITYAAPAHVVVFSLFWSVCCHL